MREFQEKVLIVSSKAQTTRERINGIYTENNVQLVFRDTPGFVEPSDAKKRQREIVTAAWQTLAQSDIDGFLNQREEEGGTLWKHQGNTRNCSVFKGLHDFGTQRRKHGPS